MRKDNFDLIPCVQGSNEWLELRQSGVGSSEAAPALGVSKFKTPLELWNEKLNPVDLDREFNWFLDSGKALEQSISKDYSNSFNQVVYNLNGIAKHTKYSFMMASLDGYTDKNLVEFKTDASFNKKNEWGEEGTNEVPEDYLLQVQHAMFVTGFEVAIIGVCFGRNPPCYYEIPADKELQEIIVDREHDFWQRVINKIEPDPVTIDEYAEKADLINDKAIYACSDINDAINNLIALKNTKKDICNTIGDVEDIIKRHLIDNDGTVILDNDNNKLLTWNQNKGRTLLDLDSFKKEQPKLFNQYKKTGKPVRTLKTYERK